MAQQFKHLFSPLKLNSMTSRNRIMSSAHHPLYIDAMGLPSDRMIGYWARKAKGGIGMVGTYLATISPDPFANTFMRPGVVDRFKAAADAVHQYGAKLVCQLANSGAQAGGYGIKGPWAPSAFISFAGDGLLYMPHEMTIEEVRSFIPAFTHASTVAVQAGCDAVELHGAHGYLFTEFLSPNSNRRTDEYGGSLENRMRFPLETIKAVRAAVGPDYPVGMRISADEFVYGGYTLDDMLVMAPLLVKAGLDWINVSSGTYASPATAIEPMYLPLNSFVYCAAAIKQVVDVPVFARGRIQDPVQAEEIIANNQADGVSMVREIIVDPDFCNKAREGRLEEIRKCLACNEGCWGNISRQRMIVVGGMMGGMSCTMNPAVGLETQYGWDDLVPADPKKKVMVIGGGPAGLEAARVAAARGHSVSLYDRGSELGGQILIAAKAPGRDGFLDLPRYYTYQMKSLNVNVHLKTDVTVDMVAKQNPDVVIVATGSVPWIPPVPGIDQKNVATVWQILNEEVQAGDNVLVIGDDMDIQSMSVADFLAGRGKKVELTCWGLHAGAKLDVTTRHTAYQRLYEKGVVITPNTRVKEIKGNTVTVFNYFTDAERVIENVDTVVVACGGKENNGLFYALKGKVKALYNVGDSNGIRRVHHATMDGAQIGRLI